MNDNCGIISSHRTAARMGTGFLLLLFSFGSCSTGAQVFPRGEAFAGFSYAHVSLGQQSTLFQPTDANYYGMHVNASWNPTASLRVILCDFGVQMGGTTVNMAPLHTDLRTSQVLFGPELVRRSERAAPFAHALIGLTNTRLVSSISGSDVVPDVAARTNLAFGVGGGLDVPWTRLLTVRAVQADYVPTRIAGSWQNQVRVSSGLVFRWNYTQGQPGR